jgi:hypothetical protein
MRLIRRPGTLVPFLVLVTMVGCGGGGDSSNSKRTAVVELTSSPTGLPVGLQLNNTRLAVKTPFTGNVVYDAGCVPSGPGGTGTRCFVVGSAVAQLTDPSKATVFLCVTDGGTQGCDSGDGGIAVTSIQFEIN